MATPRKKSAAAAKQEMQATLQEATKAAEERREAESLPAERIERRVAEAATAAADSLTLENVVKDITQLRSSVGKTLSQIAESLEAEVVKYQQVKKAIQIKEKELAEIYDIQKQAVTLAALLDAQQRKREEFEQEMVQARQTLEQEISQTRSRWEQEREARDSASKEQQEVAVRAIDGASQIKAYTGLQHALGEQSRKGE